MGGSIDAGYDGQPPAVAEWNIKSDIPAAKAVFACGVPLVMAPLDATANVKLSDVQQKKLFAAHTPLTFELESLVQLWEGDDATLHDPVAVRLAIDESFCTTKKLRLVVDEDGKTQAIDGQPNALVAMKLNAKEFTNWYVDQVTAFGEPLLPAPPKNPSPAIERRGLPRVVHAFEDYDNDIEKRWWMTGKLETNDLPEGSRRASGRCSRKITTLSMAMGRRVTRR